MATRKNTTKAAEPKVEAKEQEVTTTVKSIIEAGITHLLENVEIDNQKARYKAQRAIAYQAFQELIEADEFDALVERAIANVNELPSGWAIKPAKADPAAKKPATKKPAAKKPTKAEEPVEEPATEAAETPAKQVAKPAAKRAPRRRPARKAAAK